MSSYYISRKSFSAWISLIFAIVALFVGIQYVAMLREVITISHFKLAAAAGIPMAAVMFALAVLVFGRKRFCVMVLPVIIGCLSLTLLSSGVLSGTAVIIVGLIFLLVMAKVIKTNTLLVYALGVSVIFHIFSVVGCYLVDGQVPVKDVIFLATSSSFLFGAAGMRRDYEGYTLKWTDRANGRRVRSMPPMAQITPYFMPDRIGAQNLIRDTIELTKVEEYIAKKRNEGLKGFGFMHVFIAAYLRVIAQYPGVNRFLSGQRVFSRFNCVIAFVIKKAMTAEASDTVAKVELKPGVSADEVYAEVAKLVDENKQEEGDSTFDMVAKLFSCVPGLVLKFVVWFIKLLDYFGLLPTALEEVSPFHGSMFFTSMASLGIPVIHHHLYDFGNVPVFCAFGKKYKRNEIEKDGSVVTKRYIDYSVSVDERICDGFYFALVLKEFKRILSNPQQLDEIVQPIDDIK